MNLWVSFVIAFLFVGCGDQRIIETKPEISKAKLEKVSLKSIDGFSKDNLDLALSVFKKDCQARRINKNLKKVCLKANSYTNGYTFFIENFDGYKLLNNKDSFYCVSIVQPLFIVLTILISYFFYNEKINNYQRIGIVFVIFGILVINLNTKNL